MLVRFETANFKNFKEPVVIDFGSVGGYQFNADCIVNDTVSKMLIYGKNGTGKTNLGRAVTDIARICGVENDIQFACGAGGYGSDCEPAKFEYLFRFDQVDVQYGYTRTAEGSLGAEALYVDGAKIFDFDYANRWFWHGNLELIAAETIVVERFLEKWDQSGEDSAADACSSDPADVWGCESTAAFTPTFLRWLFANAVFSKDSTMAKLRSFVDGMHFFKVPDMVLGGLSADDCRFLHMLDGEKRQRCEEFFDTMGLKHTSEDILFSDGRMLSDGELALLHFYRRVVMKMNRQSFIYLDGFDTFFHYETAEKLFCWLKETYPNCQIILTSHNTHLMTNRLTRPDCVCVLSGDGKLMPLNRAASRELREGHNLEKLYMSGEFEA